MGIRYGETTLGIVTRIGRKLLGDEENIVDDKGRFLPIQQLNFRMKEWSAEAAE